MNQTKTSPIFIVGAPRSGTTLLTSFLVSHSNIVSGPETQFFNKIGLNTKELEAALERKNWPGLAVDLMEKRLLLADQSVISLFNKSKEQLAISLKFKKPSVGAMIESLFSGDDSQHRWLEKTPNHMLHISDIKKSFPNAKIILIHRDFRSSTLSISEKLPWASTSAIDNAALIRSWFEVFSQQTKDIEVYTISYERLVRLPDDELKALFAYIGEKFDDKVLARSSADAVTSENEPWKKDIKGKLDSSNLDAWRRKLSDNLLVQVESILGELLSKYHYKKLTTSELIPIQIKKLHGQKLDALDNYATLLTENGFTVTHNKSRYGNLYLIEKGLCVKALISVLKVRLLRKEKAFFIGKHSIFLSILGKYLAL